MCRAAAFAGEMVFRALLFWFGVVCCVAEFVRLFVWL
jgi:hypothetical protein